MKKLNELLSSYQKATVMGHQCKAVNTGTLAFPIYFSLLCLFLGRERVRFLPCDSEYMTPNQRFWVLDAPLLVVGSARSHEVVQIQMVQDAFVSPGVFPAFGISGKWVS